MLRGEFLFVFAMSWLKTKLNAGPVTFTLCVKDQEIKRRVPPRVRRELAKMEAMCTW